MDWERALAVSSNRLHSSAIRDLLAVAMRPDIISFAGGLPAPEYFPAEELRRAFVDVLTHESGKALQYGPTEGDAGLRQYLAERLAKQGIGVSPDEILVTSGSQQGLDLLALTLLGPQVTALVESPSYVGALQAFARAQPRFETAPMDADGMLVASAAEALSAPVAEPTRPAVIYSIPTFQNPSGVTMSLERRRQLLTLSRQRQWPIIEDDPYGELRYDGEHVPPLRALPGGEDVIYLGTFSKILAPGLRIGWVVAPHEVIRRLVIAKQGTDLHTNSLAQRAVLAYCRAADLDGHIVRLRTVYRLRRDAMLAALTRCFPAGVTWTTPEGGLFLWLTLPEGMDATELLADALREGVAFVPGTAFTPTPEAPLARRTLRLNFSNATPERINEGVARLAAALRTRPGRTDAAARPMALAAREV